MTPPDNHTKPFATGGHEPSEEQLLAYLEGQLSAEEANALERIMEEDVAGADALEGLQGMNGADSRRLTASINAKVRSKLAGSKKKRRGIPDQRWTWLSVGLILLLTIAAYLVMHYMKK